MNLVKEDLKAIKKIVDESVGGVKKELRAEIQSNGEGIKKELRAEIQSNGEGIKKELRAEIVGAKEEILTILGKEISDLADINRAVISRVDELDYRLRIVERKLRIGTR